MPRSRAEVVQGAHEFEPTINPISAVEFAAGRLGVEMVPVMTGGRLGLRPARRAKTLPILSTRAVQPASSHQRMKSRRLTIEVARHQPGDPALRCGADFRRRHQARPQPFAVHLQVSHPALPARIN
jgi:hypothetical protein